MLVRTHNADGTVTETNVPDPSQPPNSPRILSKTEFLAWFDAEFGANATPTRTQLSTAWPTE